MEAFGKTVPPRDWVCRDTRVEPHGLTVGLLFLGLGQPGSIGSVIWLHSRDSRIFAERRGFRSASTQNQNGHIRAYLVINTDMPEYGLRSVRKVAQLTAFI